MRLLEVHMASLCQSYDDLIDAEPKELETDLASRICVMVKVHCNTNFVVCLDLLKIKFFRPSLATRGRHEIRVMCTI